MKSNIFRVLFIKIFIWIKNKQWRAPCKIFLHFFTLLLVYYYSGNVLKAQLPEIVEAEYFWNSDPGTGNGTAISVVQDSSVDISLNIPTNTLTEGINRLYIRIKGNNGIWSHPYINPVWITDDLTGNNPKIINAECFWDNDPGLGNATQLSLTAGGAIDLTQAISTSTLTPGFHRFYIRTLDDNGIWSHTYNNPVWITKDMTVVNPQIISAECFWDNDPGLGNATQLSLTAGGAIDLTQAISTSTLTPGFHRFYIRTLDDNGIWSHTYNNPVWITEDMTVVNPQIVSAECFWDNDPGLGNATQLSLTAGGAIDLTQAISTSTLTPGFHRFYIRTLDDNGIWSHTYNNPVWITDDLTGNNPEIIIAECFWDNDPGLGNATQLSLTVGGAIDLTQAISTSTLPPGFHRFYIRTLDDNGIWSHTYNNPVWIIKDNIILFDNIVASEYFWDTEPGAGNGYPLALSAIASVIDENSAISACNLSSGNHKLYVRVLDDKGKWSHCLIKDVTVTNNGNPALLPINVSISAPVCENSSATVVAVSGNSGTYQWEESNDNGNTWISLVNDTLYSGANSNILQISNILLTMNSNWYRCIINVCGTDVISDTAILIISPSPSIIVHPSDVFQCSGTNANFSITATNASSFQWYTNNGSGWSALSNNSIYYGVDSSVLIISDITGLNNYQFQCKVSGCGSTLTSNPATLTYSSTNVWLGYATDWDNSINWACGVPTATSDVTIPASPVGGNLPLVMSNGISMCKNISIEPGAGLIIDPNANLTVYGDWDNGGSQNIGDGTVIFNGNMQTITGTTTFGHITVNITSNVNLLSSGQEISGILLCNGMLYANGNLTLLSNSTGTALISGSGLGYVNGQVTLQRFVPAAQNKGYKHFSTAFSNSIVGHFSNFMTLHLGSTSNSPFPTLFKFSEAAATPYFANGWLPAAPQGAVNTPMTVGDAYTTQLGAATGNDRTTYLFGDVNNGNYSMQVTRNNPGSGKGDGWNLIGNPYPSPIDLHKLDYTGANLNKSVSIFVSTSMYNGYYGYYNAMIGMAISGGTRHLSSLHGCFVQCMNTAGGTLTLTNAIRSDVLNPKLYKNEEQTSLPYVKLSAALNYNDEGLKDEALVVFAPDASFDNDADYDASKIMNTETAMPNIYTISNNHNLAINGLPNNFDETNEVPVGFAVKTSGIYNITASEISNMPAGIDVYLEDKALGKIQNLNINPEYTFTTDVNSNAEGRFALIFGNVSNTGLAQSDNNSNFVAWSNGEQLYVDIKGQQGSGIIQLFDALGRLILNETVETDGRYIYHPNLPPATYTVRYLNGNNIQNTKVFMN